MEHVTRHLIYSRFWHRFLYDLGVVPTKEPYAKRTAQGLILGPDGQKMSKSRGNVVDPLNVVDEFGADTLRVYILFMGDYAAAAPWSESSMRGCKRFLDRVAGLADKAKGNGVTKALETPFHRTIKKVTSDIEDMKFNTAIASMMELINEIDKAGALTVDEAKTFVSMLCPFAPHLCEEIWEALGGKGFCSLAEWPAYDEAKTVSDTIEIAVQLCGKLKAVVMMPAGASREEMAALAKADERVAAALAGKTVKKEIVVPGKIVNFVAI